MAKKAKRSKDKTSAATGSAKPKTSTGMMAPLALASLVVCGLVAVCFGSVPDPTQASANADTGTRCPDIDPGTELVLNSNSFVPSSVETWPREKGRRAGGPGGVCEGVGVGDVAHVNTVLNGEGTTRLANGAGRELFVMRNGGNEGVIVSLSEGISPCDCLLSVAEAVREPLSIRCDPGLPVSFYTWDGLPLHSDNCEAMLLHSNYRVHLLVDREVWQWAGVEIGYEWNLTIAAPFRPVADDEIGTAGAVVGFKTLSLRPRVIALTDFTTATECLKIVGLGERSVVPSPERHLEEGAYKAYRTSNSAFMHRSGLPGLISARANQILRYADPEQVENVQVVRYKPGEYYKAHQDIFHGTDPERTDTGAQTQTMQEWARWLSQQIRLHPSHQDVLRIKRETPELLPGSPDFASSLLKKCAGDKRFVAFLKDEEIALLTAPNGLAQFVDRVGFKRVRDVWESVLGRHSPLKWQPKPAIPNRYATIFMYFNDMQAGGGGHTVFPRTVPAHVEQRAKLAHPKEAFPEGHPHRVHDIFYCADETVEEGVVDGVVAVRPKVGTAALFYSKLPNMENDPLSMHAGCPPHSGIKWGGNLFTWNDDATAGGNYWHSR